MGVIFLILTGLLGLAVAKQAVEVGKVDWGRDYEGALAQSRDTRRPVLVLFQEVPGCSGCRNFGRQVLSDPAMVKVIETEFIPLLIYNNRGGKDARLLKKYGEPAWNFQVVRFLDERGEDIIPRKDRVWDKESLSQRMIRVLEAVKQPVPRELKELAGVNEKSGVPVVPKVSEAVISPIKTVAISQYCFWTGERVIGSIPGVIETEAGFIKGREVTKVSYDAGVISAEKILELAAKRGAGDALYRDLEEYHRAPDSDQKRQIQGTIFEKLSLSNAQATRINAWARTDKERALAVLTQEQRRHLGVE